jgi:uncharacterized membrane protein
VTSQTLNDLVLVGVLAACALAYVHVMAKRGFPYALWMRAAVALFVAGILLKAALVAVPGVLLFFGISTAWRIRGGA